jgi:hypothetical protein
MSFLKSKHSGWTHELKRTPFTGGGGGGGQPTQTTAYNTNIPEYARPYVENMLQSTQAQIYNDDMTGFRPYQPYSSDVNNYFAGFSPLQQSAQQAAYNMQTPGQYDVASGLAGVSGLGAFGLGTQAAGAGSQFAMNATDPGITQAYMSPYMQNVVDFQKQSALRDFQVAQPMRQAEAVAKGAFGGSRQAIVDAEAQRNLNTQLQGIQATGTQKAFEDAQRQQQFGAQLGLQGLQTGLQGYGLTGQAASTLGQLGTAQFGAEKDIANLQSTMGAQQQALEQRKIDQAIQDYAIQQQYPMMQLGFMSNMLRGLPMQAQTTQLYQAQPSSLQQTAGLIGAGASLLGAGSGRAEGGVIKMAEGGIAGYKYGGAIPEPKLESMADNLSVAQLQERIKDPALTPGERQVFQEALAAKQRMAARSEGIAAAGGDMFNTMGYAGGGILAFAEGDVVEDKERSAFQQDLIDTFGYSGAKGERPEVPEYMKKIGAYFTKPREKTTMTPAQLDAIAAKQGVFAEGSPALSEGMPIPTPTPTPAGPPAGATGSKAPSAQATETSGLSSILAGLRKEGPQGELGADYLKRLQDLESGADKRLSRADKIAMAKGFLKFGATPAPGGIGQAAIAGLGEYTEGYSKALESDEKFRMENAKLQSDIENLRRAEERGDVKLAADLQEKIADRANRLQTANISAAASGRAGAREDAYVKQLMAQGMSLEQALQAVKGAGRAESNDIARAKAALAQINEQLLLLKKDDPARAALIAQRDQITRALTSGAGAQTASGGVPKDIQGILNRYQ